MPGSDPQTGDVYYYPYLWKRQWAGAESEKDRPCCVVLRLVTGRIRGADTIMLALSQSGFPVGGYGVIVPADYIANLKRLGASVETCLVTSEFNADMSDRPSFEDREYLGALPIAFVKTVLQEMRAHLQAGTGAVDRTSSGR